MTSAGAITHIVLTRWRADAPQAALDELSQRVGGFGAAIPGIVSVVHGPSVSVEGLEAGFEWGMVVTFADAGVRNGYLVHEAHAPVAELIGAWAEQLVVFDLG